ncbi:MAG: hypothetical protein GDA36_07675 [Rhodobacteraceae bacterium]|nr:hypothetical protein [Paracoccaceae bacterium]
MPPPPRPGSHIDTPQDRAEEVAPEDHPTIRTCISVPTRKRGGSGTARRVQPDYKMNSNGLARSDGARTKKVSLTRSTPHLPTGTPCAVATMTGSWNRPPVIDPCVPGKNAGAGCDLQTPLEGLRNAYATMKRRPIVRASQNKTPNGQWRQSGGPEEHRKQDHP